MLNLVAAVLTLTAASFQYIVPVEGGSPFVPSWAGSAFVVNPHDVPVALMVNAIYPLAGVTDCPAAMQEFVIPPRRSTRLSPPPCADYGLRAISFSTDRPVVTSLDVVFRTPGVGPPQTVPVEREWFVAGEEVLISRVDHEPPTSRANLILINPDDQPILVSYRNFLGTSAIHSVIVPPRSLIVHPLLERDLVCPRVTPIPAPRDDSCTLIVESSGMFYAGVSVVRNDTQAAVYRRGEQIPREGM
jgi:hypothetical protein